MADAKSDPFGAALSPVAPLRFRPDRLRQPHPVRCNRPSHPVDAIRLQLSHRDPLLAFPMRSTVPAQISLTQTPIALTCVQSFLRRPPRRGRSGSLPVMPPAQDPPTNFQSQTQTNEKKNNLYTDYFPRLRHVSFLGVRYCFREFFKSNKNCGIGCRNLQKRP
jgi:hypothetical protein